jgi:hypothetical protein
MGVDGPAPRAWGQVLRNGSKPNDVPGGQLAAQVLGRMLHRREPLTKPLATEPEGGSSCQSAPGQVPAEGHTQ